MTLGATELRAHASGHGEELATLGLRLAVESGSAARVLAAAERRRAAGLLLRPARPPDDAALAAELAELRRVTADARRGRCATAAPNRLWSAARPSSKPPSAAAPCARAATGPARRSRRRATAAGQATAATTSRGAVAAPASRGVALDLGSPPRSGSGCSWSSSRSTGGCTRSPSPTGGRGMHVLGDEADVDKRGRVAAVQPAQPGDRQARIADGRRDGGCLRDRRAPARRAPARAAEHRGPAARDRPDRRTARAALVAAASLAHTPVDRRPVAAAVVPRGDRRAGDRTPCSSPARGCPPPTRGDRDAQPPPPATRPRSPATKPRCTTSARALDGADSAHVAAHGRFRDDNPLFCSLELADGALTVYDLERLTQAPRRLVLSSCESGLSAVHAGDELMGFTAAVFALGTRDRDRRRRARPGRGDRRPDARARRAAAPGVPPAQALVERAARRSMRRSPARPSSASARADYPGRSEERSRCARRSSSS